MLRKPAAFLLCCLLLLSPLNSSAAINSRSNLFLEMMLTMMEVMGFINRDDDYYNMPYPVYGNAFGGNPTQNWLQMMAMQQMMSGMPAGPGMMPGLTPGLWSGMNGLPGLAGNQTVIPFLPDYFNQGKTAKIHWIEGKWQASDGMIMEIHHGYFKMYYRHKPREVRGGMVRIKDRWLAIYEKSRNFTKTFEFGYKDKRLVLRDSDNNVMLFRKLPNWSVPLPR